MDKFYLNRVVAGLVEEYAARHKIPKSTIQKRGGLKNAYFTQMINFGERYSKPMSEESAMRILLAMDYRRSEAEEIVSKARIEDALEGLEDKSKRDVIQKIVGNHNIQISNN